MAKATDKVPLNREAVSALMSSLGIDSYAELARRAGLERSYVSRVMTGERPALASHVVAFATALKVPPIALLGTNDPALLDAIAAAS